MKNNNLKFNNEITYGKFPYFYPINTAKRKCRERYLAFRFTNKIPKIIFPNKGVYTMCYAYFRWLDDIVDSLRLDSKTIDFKIKRQIKFLDELYQKKTLEELSTEELFLAHLVHFDIRERKNMQSDLEQILKALEFDLKRKRKVCSEKEINWYINNMTIPYINITLKIFDLFKIPKKKLYELARCGFIIDYIYDLNQDVSLGYINITREEMESYKIDLGKLDSKQVNYWIKDKTDYLRKRICKLEGEIKRFSGLAGIFAFFLLRKRKIKLEAIRKGLKNKI